MGRNNQFGERHDLDKVDSVPQGGQPHSNSTPIKSGIDYIQQLSEYLDKQNALLVRIGELEAFADIQMGRREKHEDNLSKLVDIMNNVTDRHNEAVTKMLKLESEIRKIADDVRNFRNDGIELSTGAMNTIQSMGDIVTDELNKYVPSQLGKFSADLSKTSKEVVGGLTGITDNIHTSVSDLMKFMKRVRWIHFGVIGWATLATLFCIMAIERCTDAENKAAEANRKYEDVEPHMKHMESDQKKLLQFQKDNPRTWDKWWKKHKDDYQ